MTSISVWCPGIPVPQGSSKAFVVKGRAVITSTSKGLKDWRMQVYTAFAARRLAGQFEIFRGPVFVQLNFHMLRPKSLPKKKRTWPTTRPDLDKLVRSVLDALKESALGDDSQVVQLYAEKDWETVGPGVQVTIQEVTS